MTTTQKQAIASKLHSESTASSIPPQKGVERIEQSNSEVLPKAKRKYYTANYKLRILEQVDKCTEQGELGALLRKEGLYHSAINRWRKLRDKGALHGLSKKRGPKTVKITNEQKRLYQLEKENEKLKKSLQTAQTIIEFQKKISQLIEIQDKLISGVE